MRKNIKILRGREEQNTAAREIDSIQNAFLHFYRVCHVWKENEALKMKTIMSLKPWKKNYHTLPLQVLVCTCVCVCVFLLAYVKMCRCAFICASKSPCSDYICLSVCICVSDHAFYSACGRSIRDAL